MNTIHEKFSPLIDKIKKEEQTKEENKEVIEKDLSGNNFEGISFQQPTDFTGVKPNGTTQEQEKVQEEVIPQEPIDSVEPIIQDSNDDENSYYKRAIAASSTIVKLAHDNSDPLKQLYNTLLTDINPNEFTEADYENYCTLFHNLIESAWYDEEKKRKVLEEVEEFKNKFRKEEEHQMKI